MSVLVLRRHDLKRTTKLANRPHWFTVEITRCLRKFYSSTHFSRISLLPKLPEYNFFLNNKIQREWRLLAPSRYMENLVLEPNSVWWIVSIQDQLETTPMPLRKGQGHVHILTERSSEGPRLIIILKWHRILKRKVISWYTGCSKRFCIIWDVSE